MDGDERKEEQEQMVCDEEHSVSEHSSFELAANYACMRACKSEGERRY